MEQGPPSPHAQVRVWALSALASGEPGGGSVWGCSACFGHHHLQRQRRAAGRTKAELAVTSLVLGDQRALARAVRDSF